MTQDFEGSSSYMSRSPLAISAAGGSFFTLAWQILSEKLQEPIFDQPVCNCPLIDFKPRFRIDWISLICGILIGLLLGPISLKPFACFVSCGQVSFVGNCWGVIVRDRCIGSFDAQ